MDFDKSIELLEQMMLAMERLAPIEVSPPNPTYDLDEFKGFDWSTIEATVRVQDRFGAAIVRWGGHDYTWRSPESAPAGIRLRPTVS